MKVMFFDIDGVVCTLKSQYAFGERLLMESWDITGCQMIRRLCASNEYKIVCSSTWRKHNNTKLYFSVYGLIDYLHEDWRTTTERLGCRGEEIQEWLNRHPEVTDYIIVDDDSDLLENQKPFHIKTDSKEGFSASDFDKADKIMGNKFREYYFKRHNKEFLDIKNELLKRSIRNSIKYEIDWLNHIENVEGDEYIPLREESQKFIKASIKYYRDRWGEKI
ncbi:MAG: HAD domain-containing protein [bacterium]